MARWSRRWWPRRRRCPAWCCSTPRWTPTTTARCVTFAGEPEAVVEAAFRAIKLATELIDLTQHRGQHPRMGATDVVPFVPIEGVTLEECAELARAARASASATS